MGKNKSLRQYLSAAGATMAIWLIGIVALWVASVTVSAQPQQSERTATHVYDVEPGSLFLYQDPSARFTVPERHRQRLKLYL